MPSWRTTYLHLAFLTTHNISFIFTLFTSLAMTEIFHYEKYWNESLYRQSRLYILLISIKFKSTTVPKYSNRSSSIAKYCWGLSPNCGIYLVKTHLKIFQSIICTAFGSITDVVLFPHRTCKHHTPPCRQGPLRLTQLVFPKPLKSDHKLDTLFCLQGSGRSEPGNCHLTWN